VEYRTRGVIVVRLSSVDPDPSCECLDGALGAKPQEECGSDHVLVIETEKGFVHLSKTIDRNVDCSNLATERWVSVYLVEEQCEILGNAEIQAVHIIGPYLMSFEKSSTKDGLECRSFPIVRTPLEFTLLHALMEKSRQFIDGREASREGITNQLSGIADAVTKHIRQTIPEVSLEARQRLSQIIAHRSFVLGPLMPILLDEMTEEVYLDRPDSAFYFDHQSLGRCHTSLRIDNEDAPRIVTLLRAQSNMHLDTSNPSLKTDLQLLGTSLRVSATVPPLSPDGLNLEIRRARRRPFRLEDLVENDTMSIEAAALLMFAVANRFNVTITGEPGTGKTTLLNALDLVVPRSWRKIYVEDVVESREIPDSRQVRFKVDPVDENLYRSRKSDEIVKCLHRSPDYVILGEIQTEEHTKALFQALAAGLHVMQTCHSSSASGLVSRWNLSHNVKNVSIGLMDLIVTLKRPKPAESKRVVEEIVEVCRETQNGMVSFSGLNCIYSRKGGLHNDWAENGSFAIRAKEAGKDSHQPAFENFIRSLESSQSDSDFSVLCSVLWNNGHPMDFVQPDRPLGV
jgi:flagellar protein FlaI